MRVHKTPKRNDDYTTRFEDRDTIKRYKYRANCTSYICTGTPDYDVIVKSGVSRDDIFCPKCNSALFWERLADD